MDIKIDRWNMSANDLDRLILMHGKQAVDKALAEYRATERARVKPLSAAYRAKRREWLDGRPDYPNDALEFIEAWIKAQRRVSGDLTVSLAEIEHKCRKAARLSGVESYDVIQAQGLAKYFRYLGFKTVRMAAGIHVCGIDV